VVYDFQYVQQDFPVSASVLILSETRSMFKNALHIPAQCDHDQVHDEDEMSDDKFGQILADAELLQQLRRYFMMLTHYSELTLEKRYGVSTECSEFAQHHFVQTRKEEAE